MSAVKPANFAAFSAALETAIITTIVEAIMSTNEATIDGAK